eukprot:490502-Rhodomonas_salina.2
MFPRVSAPPRTVSSSVCDVPTRFSAPVHVQTHTECAYAVRRTDLLYAPAREYAVLREKMEQLLVRLHFSPSRPRHYSYLRSRYVKPGTDLRRAVGRR